jgi:hypothetical protein
MAAAFGCQTATTTLGDRQPAPNHPLLEVMYYLKKPADKPAPMNLGDLIQVVSESAKNQRETVAAVVNLLESGRVRVQKRRAHVTF